jgi:hypothetical protein
MPEVSHMYICIYYVRSFPVLQFELERAKEPPGAGRRAAGGGQGGGGADEGDEQRLRELRADEVSSLYYFTLTYIMNYRE